MNALNQLQKSELRDSLMSLTKCCPVDGCNPEDCPLFLVRKMSADERVQWFNGLSLEGLSYLAAYHQTCLGHKLELQMIRLHADHDPSAAAPRPATSPPIHIPELLQAAVCQSP